MYSYRSHFYFVIIKIMEYMNKKVRSYSIVILKEFIVGANIFQNRSLELTKGEEKVLNLLKQSYKNVNYAVYIYVQATISTKRPDFIIIDAEKGISIIEVKDWDKEYIRSVNKRKVNLLDNEVINPNIQVQEYKTILLSGIYSRDYAVAEEEINTTIIYTGLDEKDKEDKELECLFNGKNLYLFNNDLVQFSKDKLFSNECEGYSEGLLKKIRVSMFPEIQIISDVAGKEEREIKTLDFEQEEFAKKIPYGNYMVTGIPGSGKTVILMARAIYLVKEHPNWKVLILTYNNSLKSKLESRLDQVADEFKKDINNKDINIDNIEVSTFHHKASEIANFPTKPLNISTEEWFRTILVNYARENAKPLYDAILIDEYQDFYMNWIELCVQLCKRYEVNDRTYLNIFLAGDRLQSIYNEEDISWKSIGINMQGRSKLLKTSYRSAKQHLSVALEFLRNNKTLESEVEKFYKDDSDDNELDSLNNGTIEFINGSFEEIGNKIIELKNQGYKNEDFLILTNKWDICKEVRSVSDKRIKYQMKLIKDIDMSSIKNTILLSTYYSAKGLESKIVFLTTMDSILTNSEQIKRKLIYVGMTRASEKLYIHSNPKYDGNYINEIKDIINNQR